jgi:tripartite-type tricarboxylate transporter receptor subunit TctC
MLLLPSHLVSAQEPFYKEKVVRIIVGFSPGGGYDLYSRIIARHLARRIPGNPTIIVQNMPGAGSLISANYTYNIAKPDGLTIGNFQGGPLTLQQILGREHIEFDARKFEWLGVPLQESFACALTKASGITSLDKWFAAKKPVPIGGQAPGAGMSDYPRVLREVLGLPILLIEGYRGSARIRVAAEGGEIAGACWSWDSVKVTWREALESGQVNVVLQLSPTRHPELPQVPNAIEYAKTDDGRRLIQAAIHDPAVILRVYALPPGTPKDRVAILRKAFMDTMKDPDFLKEMEKTGLAINPLSGEETEKVVSRLFTLRKPEIARLRKILLPTK